MYMFTWQQHLFNSVNICTCNKHTEILVASNALTVGTLSLVLHIMNQTAELQIHAL